MPETGGRDQTYVFYSTTDAHVLRKREERGGEAGRGKEIQQPRGRLHQAVFLKESEKEKKEEEEKKDSA